MEEENVIEKDMTPKLIGEIFRKYATKKSTKKSIFGLFECQYCGKEFEAQTYNVRNGHTLSCGCLVGRAGIHLFYKHRFYATWVNILARCLNTSHRDYAGYGGRGITVCDEWLDVATFVAWAEATHPNISGVSIDRINNDKGYSPENCRWADSTTQSINKRIPINNTSGILGINWKTRDEVWVAQLSFQNKKKHIGQFKNIEDAILARNEYILANNLPHKLSERIN